MIVLDVDAATAAYVALALDNYSPTHRANGCAVPPAVFALRESFMRAARVVHATTREDSTGLEILTLDTPAPTPHTARMPTLLDLDHVAVDLHLSRRAVQRLIARGDLVAVHVGRSVRVRRVDLDAFVDGLGGNFRSRITTKDTAA